MWITTTGIITFVLGVLVSYNYVFGMDMSSGSGDAVMPCPGADPYINIIATCPLCLIHGILMFTAYFVLMLFGIFVSRYLRFYVNWWFPLHITSMLLSAFLAIAAYIIAVDIMPGVDGVPPEVGGPTRQTMSVHHRMGYASVGLLLLQLILGSTAHFSFDPNRRRTPWVPDKLHWFLGWFTMICAVVTIYCAIWLMVLPKNYYYMFTMFLVLVIICIGLMEVLIRVWPPKSKHHGENEDSQDLLLEQSSSSIKNLNAELN